MVPLVFSYEERVLGTHTLGIDSLSGEVWTWSCSEVMFSLLEVMSISLSILGITIVQSTIVYPCILASAPWLIHVEMASP